ncbi:hypothetical protein ACFQLX_02670 [Streptomyces polyrhachis]|uniref:Uncharacterized protein n=1 Tax=Streptomyces polyrhachis TaxID=1282885 RepID=A0ABW2GBM9_9ACTN
MSETTPQEPTPVVLTETQLDELAQAVAQEVTERLAPSPVIAGPTAAVLAAEPQPGTRPAPVPETNAAAPAGEAAAAALEPAPGVVVVAPATQ